MSEWVERQHHNDYPEFEGGRLRHADFEYLVEPCPQGFDTQEWLNRRATERWELVTADSNLCFFRRENYVIYEETKEGHIERRRLGDNS